jgi:hypothetical protein
VDVEVGADGPASAPSFGAAAAVPLAGVNRKDEIVVVTSWCVRGGKEVEIKGRVTQ